MNDKDFTSTPGSQDEAEPLSATAMFLRSFDSAPKEGEPQPVPTAVNVPPAAAASSGAGEFTRMFQSLNSTPASSASQAPVEIPPPVAKQEPPRPQTPPPAAGEFTRIFVGSGSSSAPSPIKEASAKPPVETPAASPSKMKGFSTPGLSDSASGEGSFTQFFKAASPAPTPAPIFTPPLQPAVRDASTDFPMDFGTSSKPVDTAQSLASGGATGLLSTLSGPSTPLPSSRPPEPVAYRPEPVPSYTPVAPAPPRSEAMGGDSGGVTRLIQRLSQVSKEAPPEPVIAQSPAPVPPPADSGPGEFTRMISGAAVAAAVGNPGVAAPAAPAPQTPPPAAPIAFSVTPPAMHVPAAPAPPAMHVQAAPPAFHAQAAAPAPKIELPKMEAPKLAPPAIAAPKGKLEAMVPVLLVVNTFLLVVILLVLLFALKSK